MLKYCKEKEISVLNAKGYGNRTVAEFAMGLIFDVSRNITKSFIDINKNIKEKNEYEGVELYGKTLGIIGVGAIGAELAKIAFGLGMHVVGYDLFENDELKEHYNLKYVVFFTSGLFILAITYLVLTSLAISPNGFSLSDQIGGTTIQTISAITNGIFVKYVYAFEIFSIILTLIVIGLTFVNKADKEEVKDE